MAVYFHSCFIFSLAIPLKPQAGQSFQHISKIFCRMFQFYCKFNSFMIFLFLDDIPFFAMIPLQEIS